MKQLTPALQKAKVLDEALRANIEKMCRIACHLSNGGGGDNSAKRDLYDTVHLVRTALAAAPEVAEFPEGWTWKRNPQNGILPKGTIYLACSWGEQAHSQNGPIVVRDHDSSPSADVMILIPPPLKVVEKPKTCQEIGEQLIDDMASGGQPLPFHVIKGVQCLCARLDAVIERLDGKG
jgi:hypothetical protein